MYTFTLVTNPKVTVSSIFTVTLSRARPDLVVSGSGYETRGPGSIPGCAHIFSVFFSLFFNILEIKCLIYLVKWHVSVAQLVASLSGVVLGGAVEVVGSNLARGKIFTASIDSVDLLYPSSSSGYKSEIQNWNVTLTTDISLFIYIFIDARGEVLPTPHYYLNIVFMYIMLFI